MPDNISDSINTTGRVTVGNSLTGEIETTDDSDAYAVELVAGRTYRIDLEGAATGKGTLADPFLRWLRDSSGNGLHGTRDYDGGEGLNPRQVFTPQLSGTYYITASGQGNSVGTYTLTVTDTSAPVFGASAYGFQLAENTDGSTTRVSLGTVSATDPEGVSVGYSIVGGNESGSFEIDAASGELFYVGAGEDYESDATSYDLTVQASDGQLTADTTVTVTVTDVSEAPAFGQQDYTFELAENSDGSTTRVSLGMVSATDPEGASVGYSIVGGNESGSFEIDAASGELFYVGSGEDYEAGAAQFDLTIRASDGTLTADAAVSVAITDVPEQTIVVPVDPEILQTVSELAGRVTVGNSLTGEIETTNDSDAYAVELVAGRTYRIDLEGAATGKGTLVDPFLRWLRDSSGNGLHGTRDYDGGEGLNPRQVFTPQLSGTYYITASGQGASVGTYTLTVTDTSQQQVVQQAPVFGQESYAFTLAENADGALFGIAVDSVSAADPEGAPVTYSIEAGDPDGLFMIDAETGLVVYVGTGEDYESGTTSYELTVRASDGSLHSDATVTVNVTDVEEYAVLEQTANEAPAFAYASYAFTLAENADGGTDRVSVGTVTATDPDNDPVAYSIEGGNESGSFEIDAQTGELFYVGTGEDYEAGAAQFDLTIQASDGGLHSDVTVNVNVTDVAEAPAFGQDSYVFDLPENADGGTVPLALGPVQATDPENSTIVYSIEAGDPGGLFAIDAATGALSYRGAGEDYESGTRRYDLTVRASDGTNSTDTTVTVNVGDVQEAPAFGQESYAFTLAENADGGTNGVSLGTVTATDPDNDPVAYSIEGGNASGLFEIDAQTGELFYVGAGEDYEAGAVQFDLTIRASDGTLTADAAVSVAITDVPEQTIVVPADPEILQTVSELAGEDFSTNISTAGRIVVDDTATGNIGTRGDGDWFAVELVADREYQIDLRGSPTGDGTLSDPYLDGIYDAEGTLIHGTTNDDGGAGYNSRVTFTARETGTYYIEAGAFSHYQGTYEIEVRDVSPQTAQQETENGPPAFGQASYGFTLAENADGSTTGVSLGTVAATDPDDDPVAYSIAGGNESGSFEIDATSGELFYVGTGENYETGSTRFDLTVRASDETNSTDTTVIVNVTDVHESNVSEPEGTDFPENFYTPGRVVVGGSVSGRLESTVTSLDSDWFAVELTAGRTYVFDLETGFRHVRLDIYDPYGVDAERGRWGSYTPSESGTYYVAVRSDSYSSSATYTLGVIDDTDEDASRESANDLGDITTIDEVRLATASIGEYVDEVDYYRFTLSAPKAVTLELLEQDADANLILEAEDGNILHSSHGGGRADETISATLLAGTYFVRINAQQSRNANDYVLRYGVSDADSDEVARLEAAVGGPPASVPEPEGLDFPASVDTPGRLLLGESVTGRVDFLGASRPDVDWFAITVEAGRIYRVDLEGSETERGTLRNPQLDMYDSEGQRFDWSWGPTMKGRA